MNKKFHLVGIDKEISPLSLLLVTSLLFIINLLSNNPTLNYMLSIGTFVYFLAMLYSLEMKIHIKRYKKRKHYAFIFLIKLVEFFIMLVVILQLINFPKNISFIPFIVGFLLLTIPAFFLDDLTSLIRKKISNSKLRKNIFFAIIFLFFFSFNHCYSLVNASSKDIFFILNNGYTFLQDQKELIKTNFNLTEEQTNVVFILIILFVILLVTKLINFVLKWIILAIVMWFLAKYVNVTNINDVISITSNLTKHLTSNLTKH